MHNETSLDLRLKTWLSYRRQFQYYNRSSSNERQQMQFRSNKFPEAFIVKKELNVIKRSIMEAGLL